MLLTLAAGAAHARTGVQGSIRPPGGIHPRPQVQPISGDSAASKVVVDAAGTAARSVLAHRIPATALAPSAQDVAQPNRSTVQSEHGSRPVAATMVAPDAHVDGRLIHLINSIQLLIQRVDDPGGIKFNLPISSWMRLFDDIGFDVIDYIEVRAPESATGPNETATADWARRFPSEQVWRLSKR